MSETDVYRHQILTTKVDPHTVRVNPCAAELFAFIFRHLKPKLKTRFPASNDKTF